jgi:hypothetical protein
MKYIYLAAILAGFGIVVYFYGFNFDKMSETDLVNSVLYWYVPLTFGLYGLAANLVKKTADGESGNALKFIFSGKNAGLTVLGVLLIVMSGVVGFLLFMIPLAIFKMKSKVYDLSVAILGSGLWLVGLYFFFQVLWPSL